MNANDELERRIADFYARETPPRAPDWVLESAIDAVDSTKQRRVFIRAPWRFPNMSNFAKLAVAAVAVIAVGAVGLAVLRPSQPGIGPGAAPSARSSPALTATFTSNIHGISVSHPAGWTVRPATEPWLTSLPMQGPAGDYISDPANDNRFLSLTSQPLAGKTGEEWAAGVAKLSDWGDTCNPPSEPVTIDGAAGIVVVRCDGTFTAMTAAQNRGYLIIGYGWDDRAMFDEILATVRLHPEDAADTAPSASPAGG